MARNNDHQLNFGPLPLRSSERDALRHAEQDRREEERRLAEQITADLLDGAITAAGLDNKEVAYVLGVSRSLVEKWRSKDQRGSPSFLQLWDLGTVHPPFAFELHRAINKRCSRLGLQALARIITDLGALAMAVSR
jgi:transcriptional regulator with XRE-family HTH domain